MMKLNPIKLSQIKTGDLIFYFDPDCCATHIILERSVPRRWTNTSFERNDDDAIKIKNSIIVTFIEIYSQSNCAVVLVDNKFLAIYIDYLFYVPESLL